MRHYAPHNTHFQAWASSSPSDLRHPSSTAPSLRQRLASYLPSWRTPSPTTKPRISSSASSIHQQSILPNPSTDIVPTDDNPVTPPPSPSASTTQILSGFKLPLASSSSFVDSHEKNDINLQPRLSALSKWLHLSPPLSQFEKRALQTLTLMRDDDNSTSKNVNVDVHFDNLHGPNARSHCILCDDSLDEEIQQRKRDSSPNLKRGGRTPWWFSTDSLVFQIFAYMSFWALLLCVHLISFIRHFRKMLYRKHLLYTKKIQLMEQMNQAKSYSQWYNAASILDLLDGNHSWMFNASTELEGEREQINFLCEECDNFLNSKDQIRKRKLDTKRIGNDINALFDTDMVSAKLKELSFLYMEGDIRGLAFALRASLARNFAGMYDPGLHAHSRIRTHQIIEDYVHVVSYLLAYVSQAEHHFSSFRVDMKQRNGNEKKIQRNSPGTMLNVQDSKNNNPILDKPRVQLESSHSSPPSDALPLSNTCTSSLSVSKEINSMLDRSAVVPTSISASGTPTNLNNNYQHNYKTNSSLTISKNSTTVKSTTGTTSASSLFISTETTSSSPPPTADETIITPENIKSQSDPIKSTDTEIRIDDPRTLSIEDKLTFLNEARHAHGRTALMLSGGAVMGLHHLGIVNALVGEGLLPRVVCGTSAGALIASIVGTLDDNELHTLLFTNVEDKVKQTENNNSSDSDTLSFINPSTGLEYGFQFFREPVTWRNRMESFLKHGYLEDVGMLQETLRKNYGEKLTFQEAYEKTGRILNITVCPTRRSSDPPLLLNYLTAPHVLIWSAASASCALPIMFRPVELVAKSANGRLVPYHSDGSRWMDGSVSSDVPLARIGELFNVNHFIVSQTNPHVIPRSFPILNTRLARLIKSELQFRYWQLTQVGLVPRLISAIFPHFMQPYAGDVTIMPDIRISDLSVLMKNPTADLLTDFLNRGQLQTYPYLDIVRLHCSIERVLDKCVENVATTISMRKGRMNERLKNYQSNHAGNYESGESSDRKADEKNRQKNDESGGEWPSLSSGTLGLFGRVPSWLWLDTRSILPKGGVRSMASRLATKVRDTNTEASSENTGDDEAKTGPSDTTIDKDNNTQRSPVLSGEGEVESTADNENTGSNGTIVPTNRVVEIAEIMHQADSTQDSPQMSRALNDCHDNDNRSSINNNDIIADGKTKGNLPRSDLDSLGLIPCYGGIDKGQVENPSKKMQDDNVENIDDDKLRDGIHSDDSSNYSGEDDRVLC